MHSYHVCMYTYVRIHSCMYVYIFVYLDIYMHMCVFINMYVCVKIREAETERRANLDTLCFLYCFIFQDFIFSRN